MVHGVLPSCILIQHEKYEWMEEMYVEDRGIWSRESETLGSEAFLETNVGMLTEIGRKRERALGRTGSGVWRRKIYLAN